MVREWDGVEITRSLLFGSSNSALKRYIWLVFHIVKLTWHIMIIALISYHFLTSGSSKPRAWSVPALCQIQYISAIVPSDIVPNRI